MRGGGQTLSLLAYKNLPLSLKPSVPCPPPPSITPAPFLHTHTHYALYLEKSLHTSSFCCLAIWPFFIIAYTFVRVANSSTSFIYHTSLPVYKFYLSSSFHCPTDPPASAQGRGQVSRSILLQKSGRTKNQLASWLVGLTL